MPASPKRWRLPVAGKPALDSKSRVNPFRKRWNAIFSCNIVAPSPIAVAAILAKPGFYLVVSQVNTLSKAISLKLFQLTFRLWRYICINFLKEMIFRGPYHVGIYIARNPSLQAAR
ncbi:exported hypothetical protein [Candidatus Competibacter denitrificans Run_A_D11]|uniref:Uncharacterized protein n=1 Tax=Candidatus Competibacter denitrificans Run_A_D11 TaxID=1400863 RepID=W6M5F2_9GAMM|nr:exported hypothetical protein [Candidatus Competibacter denitrificans Run_A_D11]